MGLQYPMLRLAVAFIVLGGMPLLAQDQPAKKVAAANAAQPSSGFRHIVPGVERTIDPESKVAEGVSQHNLLDLLKDDPQFGERPCSNNLAQEIRFTHDTWTLEFTFKPLRFIDVDLPNNSGRFDRKTVWYLVYHVKNLGKKPVRFIPRFLLYSWDKNKYYPDRLIPLAIPQIERREDPNRSLLDTVAISESPIPPSTTEKDRSVYGVATWQDIDTQTDRFSIYLQGLSNAYFWLDEEEKPGTPRKYYRKTLQMNFWRPGDDFFEHEREVRFGIPGEVDYQWIYR